MSGENADTKQPFFYSGYFASSQLGNEDTYRTLFL